jgi:1,4-dihydroxy-2-naphthoyl-CoA synthase
VGLVLVYDPRGLPGVTTARSEVAEVLQMVSELTLAVSQARTGQLRRIRWRTGQGRGYVRMTHGSSRRDTIWYVCC